MRRLVKAEADAIDAAADAAAAAGEEYGAVSGKDSSSEEEEEGEGMTDEAVAEVAKGQRWWLAAVAAASRLRRLAVALARARAARALAATVLEASLVGAGGGDPRLRLMRLRRQVTAGRATRSRAQRARERMKPPPIIKPPEGVPGRRRAPHQVDQYVDFHALLDAQARARGGPYGAAAAAARAAWPRCVHAGGGGRSDT